MNAAQVAREIFELRDDNPSTAIPSIAEIIIREKQASAERERERIKNDPATTLFGRTLAQISQALSIAEELNKPLRPLPPSVDNLPVGESSRAPEGSQP